MAVTRPPRKPQAVTTDDKAAEEFIKGGGAPVLAADRGVRQVEAASEHEPRAAAKRERKPDLRETPRFSIRLEKPFLKEIEESLEDAKKVMGIPRHIRLTKSDFIEWAIREAITKVKKSAK